MSLIDLTDLNDAHAPDGLLAAITSSMIRAASNVALVPVDIWMKSPTTDLRRHAGRRRARCAG
jgi:hypothetical protein